MTIQALPSISISQQLETADRQNGRQPDPTKIVQTYRSLSLYRSYYGTIDVF